MSDESPPVSRRAVASAPVATAATKSLTEWAAIKGTPDFLFRALIAYHALDGTHGPAWWPQGHEQDPTAKHVTEAQYDAAVRRADGLPEKV